MENWVKNNKVLALLLLVSALLISAVIASFAIFVFVASPNRSAAWRLFIGAAIPAVPFLVVGVVMLVAYVRSRSDLSREGEQSESHPSIVDQPDSPRSGYSGLAIAGFTLAFGSTIVGLFVSIAALAQIRRTGQSGRGLALAGIWISSSAILLGLIALILAGARGLLPWQY